MSAGIPSRSERVIASLDPNSDRGAAVDAIVASIAALDSAEIGRSLDSRREESIPRNWVKSKTRIRRFDKYAAIPSA